MNKIQLFEPALCCSTGICGVDVDPALVEVTADLDWARSQGADVVRANLAQDPAVFAQNEAIRAFLQTAGSEGLPVTQVEGVTVLTGRYPTRDELSKWSGLQAPAAGGRAQLGLTEQPARDGGCCGGAADGAADDACCAEEPAAQADCCTPEGTTDGKGAAASCCA